MKNGGKGANRAGGTDGPVGGARRRLSRFGPPFSIVVCYARKDRESVAILREQLEVLEILGLARVFWDGDIIDGEGWQERIEREIDRADLALVMVSASLLTSPFVTSVEIPRLLRRTGRGLRLVPVLLRDCPWQACPWLAARQIFTANDQPLKASTLEETETRFASLVNRVLDWLDQGPDDDPDDDPPAEARNAVVDSSTAPAADPRANVIEARERFRRKKRALRLARRILSEAGGGVSAENRPADATVAVPMSTAPRIFVIGFSHSVYMFGGLDGAVLKRLLLEGLEGLRSLMLSLLEGDRPDFDEFGFRVSIFHEVRGDEIGRSSLHAWATGTTAGLLDAGVGVEGRSAALASDELGLLDVTPRTEWTPRLADGVLPAPQLGALLDTCGAISLRASSPEARDPEVVKARINLSPSLGPEPRRSERDVVVYDRGRGLAPSPGSQRGCASVESPFSSASPPRLRPRCSSKGRGTVRVVSLRLAPSICLLGAIQAGSALRLCLAARRASDINIQANDINNHRSCCGGARSRPPLAARVPLRACRAGAAGARPSDIRRDSLRGKLPHREVWQGDDGLGGSNAPLG